MYHRLPLTLLTTYVHVTCPSPVASASCLMDEQTVPSDVGVCERVVPQQDHSARTIHCALLVCGTHSTALPHRLQPL